MNIFRLNDFVEAEGIQNVMVLIVSEIPNTCYKFKRLFAPELN